MTGHTTPSASLLLPFTGSSGASVLRDPDRREAAD